MKVIFAVYVYLKKIILVPCKITVAVSVSLFRKFLNIKIPLFCNKEYIKNSFGLIFVCFMSFLLTAGLIFIASKTQPGNIDCHVYNETTLKSGSKFDQILQTNLLGFLKKYLKHDFEEKRWTELVPGIFVYSAFIDTCNFYYRPSLSLCALFIGITLTNVTEIKSPLKCALRRDHETVIVDFFAVDLVPEEHLKLYSAAYFICNIKGFMHGPTWAKEATIFAGNISSVSSWVPIKYLASNRSSSAIAPSLCVRPLYGTYSSLSLSEFIAYYSVMGVEHFIFYVHNISEYRLAFLKFLKTTDLSVEVLLWDVPVSSDLIHEYGQMVFTQDCIVRSRYTFSHTIIVDMDEFIVPKFHSSITDLLFYLDHQQWFAGSFVIPMVLFCKEYSYEPQNSLHPVFKFNKRQKTVWSHDFRSKYIVKPERVNFGGIHFVWMFRGDWVEMRVPSSVALVHHYRKCCGMVQSWFLHIFNFHVLHDDVVIDNTLASQVPKVMNHTLITFMLNFTNLTLNNIKVMTALHIV